MGFQDRTVFGRTGQWVKKIGLASGYGVPAASIERAYHEYGVNYLYVSPVLNLDNITQAIGNLVPRHREDMFIVLARPYLGGYGGWRLEKFVDRWLNRLGLEWVDLLLQDVRRPFGEKLNHRIEGLKERGKVRFAGVSSHSRSFLGELAGGVVNAPSDFFHVRYNAVHTGAEQEVFPHLPGKGGPGVAVYTATCWRKLLNAKPASPRERPLTAADCYRFVLSNADVGVCLTAPSTPEQMEDNLKALDAGPLNGEEMAHVRRIGDQIYGKQRTTDPLRNDLGEPRP